LPGLAHWFGIRPWDIDDLTFGELDMFVQALGKLPPVGGTVLVEMRK
jgi:hypothetical protein